MTATRPYALPGANALSSQGALATLFGALGSSSTGNAVGGAAVAAVPTATAVAAAAKSSPAAAGGKSAAAATLPAPPAKTPAVGSAAAAAATGVSAPDEATHAPASAADTTTSRSAAPAILATESAVPAADRPMSVRGSRGSVDRGLMSNATLGTGTAAEDTSMAVTGDEIRNSFDDPRSSQPMVPTTSTHGSSTLPQQQAPADAAGAVLPSQPLTTASPSAAPLLGMGVVEAASVLPAATADAGFGQ
ncbi:hypothetical protein Vretifemale_4630, partial [Volvox reticuliferus]